MKIRSVERKVAVGEILAVLMMHKGWSQSKLSTMSGVSQPAINRILRLTNPEEGMIRRPHDSTLKKLCDALNVSLDQIVGDSPLTPREIGSRSGAILRVSDVPLVDLETIGLMGCIENYQYNGIKTWLSCPIQHSERTFAFKIVTDEMGGVVNGYNPGDIVFIDPLVIAEKNDCVMVRRNDCDIVFRQLQIIDGGIYLSVINPIHHDLLCPFDGCEIVGTAIVVCRIRESSLIQNLSIKNK